LMSRCAASRNVFSASGYSRACTRTRDVTAHTTCVMIEIQVQRAQLRTPGSMAHDSVVNLGGVSSYVAVRDLQPGVGAECGQGHEAATPWRQHTLRRLSQGLSRKPA
jgi:hypothetical protein